MIRRPNYFLKGEGSVVAGLNKLDVRITGDPHDDVVLKYNWAESLSAPDPMEIYPYDADKGIRLIGNSTPWGKGCEDTLASCQVKLVTLP